LLAALPTRWRCSPTASTCLPAGIAAFAYRHARRHADDRRYSFGTGKVGSLAAFTSAIILGMVALLMVWKIGGHIPNSHENLYVWSHRPGD